MNNAREGVTPPTNLVSKTEYSLCQPRPFYLSFIMSFDSVGGAEEKLRGWGE